MSRRERLVARAAVTLAALLPLATHGAACSGLRDFVIPPPAGPQVSGTERAAPDVIIDAVHLAADATAVSVAVRSGRIVAIGPRLGDEAKGSLTRRIDGRGALLLPGFADAHVHLEGVAMLTDAVDVGSAGEIDAVAARLHARGVSAEGDWIWATGARAEVYARLGATGLDRLRPAPPAYVSARDGHGGVVTHAAIAMLPPALAGQVRARDGRLDGALGRQVWRALPAPRRQRMVPLLDRALIALAARGISEVHSMGDGAATLAALRDLEQQGRLSIRTRVYLDVADARAPELVRASTSDRIATRPPLVTVEGVKLWLDGTLGGRTAALGAPYHDAPGTGVMTPDAGELLRWLAIVDEAGAQLAIHALGDAAVRHVAVTLRGLARPAGAARVRLEHAQVVDDATLPLLTGFLCSIQPLHRSDDHAFAAARLGPERIRWAYRGASLAASCPLLSGSDLPISAAEPWRMIADLQGEDAPPRAESERLNVAAAMETLWRSPRDGHARSVRIGEVADLAAWRVDATGGKTLLWTMVDGQLKHIGEPGALR